MVGAALKIFGILLLVGGLVGAILGVGLFVYGQQRIDDSDDRLVVPEPGPREEGEQAQEAGATVLGASLFTAGLGLVCLVAGIVVGGRRRAAYRQQQVVVLANGQAPLVQPHQRPPVP